MLKSTCSDYAEYVKIDMSKELTSIENSIDAMLTRLDEFESMICLVQQERGNVVGLTGSLPQILDNKKDIDKLCSKIDVLESLVSNVRETLDSLEEELETAEEQTGFVENTSIRNFFTKKIFKKTPDNKTQTSRTAAKIFKTEDYFVSVDDDKQQ